VILCIINLFFKFEVELGWFEFAGVFRFFAVFGMV
jgi:hypothetical protein